MKENFIDENSVLSRHNLQTELQSKGNSRTLSTIDAFSIQSVPPPHNSGCQTTYQSTRATFHTPVQPDSNQLYLKDMKNFLGLRKAAINCDQRKLIQNEKMTSNRKKYDSGLLVTQFKALKKEKIYYDDVQEDQEKDRVNTELTMNLMNIMQSLDTNQFLKGNETLTQHARRLDNSVENNMESID